LFVPWRVTSPSQFRADPPPALSSATWAQDYNETKEVGGKNSTRRTAEQTAMGKQIGELAVAKYLRPP
jgi:hypothetical protein